MNTYEIKFRFLEKEIFAFSVGSSSEDAGWLNRATLITVVTVVLIGTYGNELVELYHKIFG